MIKIGDKVKYSERGTIHEVLGISNNGKLAIIEIVMFGQAIKNSVSFDLLEVVAKDVEVSPLIDLAVGIHELPTKTIPKQVILEIGIDPEQAIPLLNSLNFPIRDSERIRFTHNLIKGNYIEFILKNNDYVFNAANFGGMNVFQFERIFYFDKKIVGDLISYILKFERGILNTLKSLNLINHTSKKSIGELEAIFADLNYDQKKSVSSLWGITDIKVFGYTLWLFRVFRNSLAHNNYVKLVTIKVAANMIGGILYKEGINKKTNKYISTQSHNENLAIKAIITLREYINAINETLSTSYRKPVFSDLETCSKLDQNSCIFIELLFLLKIMDSTNTVWENIRQHLVEMIGFVNDTGIINQSKGMSLIGINDSKFRSFTSFNSKYK